MIVAVRSSILFFLSGVVVSMRCPQPSRPRHGTIACYRGNVAVDCRGRLPVGAVVEVSCGEFYKLSGGRSRECRPDGRWSSPSPKCVADCGRRSSSVSLVVNGAVAPRGAFPWHVAIYNSFDGSNEYWCGGSLISEMAVVTAAHCVWKIEPENLTLVFGKFHREYNLEEGSQKRKPKRIETLSSYQDVEGNYNGDVAVVFLEEAVHLGHHSAPACIDWDQRLSGKLLIEGSFGVALGWGFTENDTFSDLLRVVRLPVVSEEKCIAEQERDFRKFVTYTSFCAGFGNGTGVCNGDSGGGLTFYDDTTDRWYLLGLVSVSPRREGTPYCDLNFYTVFTKVSAFSEWLKAQLRPDGGKKGSGGKTKDFRSFAVKYFRKNDFGIGGETFTFPHTKKMLELNGFFSKSKNNKTGKER